MLDDPKTIMKKFKRAVTDSETEVRYDVAEKPGVSGLLDILAAVTDRTPQQAAEGYTQYGALKVDTGEAGGCTFRGHLPVSARKAAEPPRSEPEASEAHARAGEVGSEL